jgi:hypothetical protein
MKFMITPIQANIFLDIHKRIQIKWQTIFIICGLLFFPWNSYAKDSPSTKNKTIASLLDKAEQALTQNRLSTPARDNAVTYIERVLAIAPQHPDAIRLLEQITARYNELVAAHFEHSEQAMQQSLMQTRILHEHTQNITDKHEISNSALIAMEHKIANYEATFEKSRMGSGSAKETPNNTAEDLLERHITYSTSALKYSDIKEARWHAQQADAVANRYQLISHKLQPLKDRILAATKNNTLRKAKEIRELIRQHIRLGKQALSERDTNKAQSHQAIAEEIALQYNIENTNLEASSTPITRQRVWNSTGTDLRIFGTF